MRAPRAHTQMMKTLIGIVVAIVAAVLLAGPAGATPGRYTNGGDVLVTVAVAGGCATVTWPKGTTDTVCEVYQTRQHDIVPGDTFGASIKSYSGGAVSCSVLDIESGDRIYSDSAGPYGTANCLRYAKKSTNPGPPAFGSLS